MIFGMTIQVFVHVVLSLIGIGAGLVVVYGLLVAERCDRWTAVFLASTLATCLTGFVLPADRFLPSHAVGLIGTAVLAVAIFALYGRRLAGAWRWIYAAAAVVSLYLNVFVLVVQLFLKVPALKALAPTQSEPPFQIVQLIVLIVFAGLTIAAARRFRPAPIPTA